MKGTLSLLACVMLAGCHREPSPTDGLLGIDGNLHAVLPVAEGQVHVVVFTSHECPIANSYAPTLRELAGGWQGTPIRLFVVHCGPDLGPAQAAVHARQFELPGTVLLDPHLELAQRLGAQRTPEAVVVTASGTAYRGRIDDQWAALGSRRAAADHHDLRDAVTSALTGRAVPTPWPAAVGCLLPEAAPR